MDQKQRLAPFSYRILGLLRLRLHPQTRGKAKMLRGILPKVAKRASDNAIRCSVSLPGGHTNCFQKGARRIKFEAAMTLDEILEQLPKLTDDEKRQLWNILDHELNGEGEESPEFLAELDARIRALDHGTRTYSLDEARQMVRNTVARARR
jgi:hypothetical protein